MDRENLPPKGYVLQARALALVPYEDAWRAMNVFTDSRTADTEDEVWLLEHFPVYTIGRSGSTEHLHNTQSIMIVHTDRGGDVTYHGPGQIIMYCLLDLKRRKIGVRQVVHALEEGVVRLLAQWGIEGMRRKGAPGIYVGNAKIASLGLRVRRGCSYHGMSFNFAMDTAPFSGIDPCGYAGLQITSVQELLGLKKEINEQKNIAVACLPSIVGEELNYSYIRWKTERPAALGI